MAEGTRGVGSVDRQLLQSVFLQDEEGRDPDYSEAVEKVFALLAEHDMWLRVSMVAEETDGWQRAQLEEPSLKPSGRWYSRGDWLLHEAGGMLPHVSLARARADQLLIVRTQEERDAMVRDYGASGSANTRYNWAAIAKNHAGFCMPVNLYKLGDPRRSLVGFDVSTLVAWDPACLVVVATTHHDGDAEALLDWVTKWVAYEGLTQAARANPRLNLAWSSPDTGAPPHTDHAPLMVQSDKEASDAIRSAFKGTPVVLVQCAGNFAPVHRGHSDYAVDTLQRNPDASVLLVHQTSGGKGSRHGVPWDVSAQQWLQWAPYILAQAGRPDVLFLVVGEDENGEGGATLAGWGMADILSAWLVPSFKVSKRELLWPQRSTKPPIYNTPEPPESIARPLYLDQPSDTEASWWASATTLTNEFARKDQKPDWAVVLRHLPVYGSRESHAAYVATLWQLGKAGKLRAKKESDQ
jgi:hypothetical protein